MRMSLPAVGRSFGLSLCLAVTAACAARSNTAVTLDDPVRIRALFDSLDAVRVERELAASEREDGPRVDIWSDESFILSNRVRASFRLQDDAYVAVFNVGRDGRITTVYPESPEDPTLLRAGHTYRLPEYFPGFSRSSFEFGGNGMFRSASFGGTGSPARDGGGYIFIVASWSPLRMDLLEEKGLIDAYRNVSFGSTLQPYSVMHEYAETLVPRGRRWYSVDYHFYQQASSPFAYSRCEQGMSDYSMLVRLLQSGNVASPLVRQMILADIALASGCDMSGAYRAYLTSLIAGYGQLGGTRPVRPTLPTTPPPTPTDSGAGTSNPGSGSQPAAPRDPRDRGGRPRIDDCVGPKCDEPVRQPRRRGESGTEDEGTIDLGGRRGPRDADRAKGNTRWAEMTHRPIREVEPSRDTRERRGWESPRTTPAGAQRRPGGDGAAERPRSEPVRERPRQEQPVEQPRRSEPRQEAPRQEPPRQEPRQEPRQQPRQEPRIERIERVEVKPVPVQPAQP